MNLDEFTTEVEEDLRWRADELRTLRNTLLSDLAESEWTTEAMRVLMVMQYAHLEGFTRHALSVYVRAVNELQLGARQAQSHLVATSMSGEFHRMRRGANDDVGPNEEGRLMRRARREVGFVERVRAINDVSLALDEDESVSMEMNLGSDVLRRSLYRLAIPPGAVEASQYGALEFIRRARNDIAHGGRTHRIDIARFRAHIEKSERFMGDLRRLLTLALAQEWYRQGAVEVR